MGSFCLLLFKVRPEVIALNAPGRVRTAQAIATDTPFAKKIANVSRCDAKVLGDALGCQNPGHDYTCAIRSELN
jgi:hypothetical protein